MSSLLSAGLLWSTAIYVEEEGFAPGDPFRSKPLVFNTKQFRRPLDHVHTRADPFLFVRGDELFLFLEVQPYGRPAHIEAYSTSDLKDWAHLGEVLREPHHLSYPFVFSDGDAIYMIPESSAAGEVALYRFEDFPRRLTKVRRLLEAPFVDSSPLRLNEIWYLFTTSSRGLELFFTDDLITGELRPHPLNPITGDPAYSRCGGVPLRHGQALYRPAQDCSVSYGGNLNLMQIEEISPTDYRETEVRHALFAGRESWNSLGGHHMHMVQFGGKTVVAVDGRQADYRIHKLRRLASKVRPRRRRR